MLSMRFFLDGNHMVYVIFLFSKMCSSSNKIEVQFLQVIDEYDEQSEVAERLRIKVNTLYLEQNNYFQAPSQ